ncbi:MAG TPA: hypothetical protein VMN38_05815 [Sphingomicrobium sp.]|nr:hypothetical protein [Sphingomicrobium sp.]
MLQINTGKLFTRAIGRTNRLRGVLYANLHLPRDEAVVTGAGTLLGTNSLRSSRALVYEIDERIEDGPDGPGVLVSHGVESFLSDFAAIASFGFDAIVAPDAVLVERLLSGKPTLASYEPPKEFLNRTFTNEIWLKPEETAEFTAFVEAVLGLERRTFNAAMRAIRTYVSGVHRLLDDLGVAYTLMVSAIESLAQDFDGYATSWNDVDERKRIPVEAALRKASPRTAQNVREAISSTEHTSLGRRYRAFVKAHINKEYFRDPSLAGTRALAACELDEALRRGYAVRSRYLHNLRVLPDAITHPFGHWEVAYVDRHAVLTFQGLARLTRHVIREFVARGHKVDKEPYDYRREEAGIRFVEMAPQYWVWQPLRHASEARRRLEGHLSQLANVLTNAPDAALTDLRPMLGDVERLIDKASAQNQAAMFALYGLFNVHMVPEQRMPRFREILEQHAEVVARPSIESLVAFTIVDETEKWPIEVHRDLVDTYFAKRAVKAGLQAPSIFESAMCLTLAERYRLVGQSEDARAMIGLAVENAPGNRQLLDFEASFDPIVAIAWRDVLLPS